MRRRLYTFTILLLAASCLMFSAWNASTGSLRKSASFELQSEPRIINVTQWGPDQQVVDAAKSRLMKHPLLQTSSKGPERRLLSCDFVEKPKSHNTEPPDSYVATAFDYTSNRALTATGRFDSPDVVVTESQAQPDPSEEEFQAAVAVLMRDPKVGAALRANKVDTYAPMPPLINGHLPVGKTERTLAVGIIGKTGLQPHEIVGVNMIRRTVIRFPNNAPPTSIASSTSTCGVANAFQGVTPRGTAGQYQVTISRGSTQIWSFLVVRPSVSSGTRGSGVELRDVDYLGKRVLTRAHAPILNVQYAGNACGPYRDWNYSEDSFAATGTDVAPGVRVCTSPPSTVLDSDNDTGNFFGVAIWDNREQVRIVSELNASWYRYISEWIFRDDGVILPRFGFGGVTNSCVCNTHNHHVYWRFDFDVVSTNNTVAESIGGVEQNITVEGMRPRVSGASQEWIIKNATGNERCVLIPGPTDGNFDKYSRGDVWVVRSHFPSEIDDGVNCTNNCETRANIQSFVNAESVSGVDIVMWYSGHFFHNDHDENSETEIRALGPTIMVQRY